MTEKEFRQYIQASPRLADRVEEVVKDTSAEALKRRAQSEGDELSDADAEKFSAELRKRFVVSNSLYESGLASKDDLLDMA